MLLLLTTIPARIGYYSPYDPLSLPPLVNIVQRISHSLHAFISSIFPPCLHLFHFPSMPSSLPSSLHAFISSIFPPCLHLFHLPSMPSSLPSSLHAFISSIFPPCLHLFHLPSMPSSLPSSLHAFISSIFPPCLHLFHLPSMPSSLPSSLNTQAAFIIFFDDSSPTIETKVRYMWANTWDKSEVCTHVTQHNCAW